jgi:hypothetical protein
MHTYLCHAVKAPEVVRPLYHPPILNLAVFFLFYYASEWIWDTVWTPALHLFSAFEAQHELALMFLLWALYVIVYHTYALFFVVLDSMPSSFWFHWKVSRYAFYTTFFDAIAHL